MMARTATQYPIRKVSVGTLAAALTALLSYLLNTYILPEPLPAEITQALMVIIGAVLAYLVPPAEQDGVVLHDDG